jgi:hypothetical protein
MPSRHWSADMPRADMVDEIETLRARVRTDYAELVGHAKEAERLRAALTAIRDHGQTHDQPCYAITNGDCADVMQEIARTALHA